MPACLLENMLDIAILYADAAQGAATQSCATECRATDCSGDFAPHGQTAEETEAHLRLNATLAFSYMGSFHIH